MTDLLADRFSWQPTMTKRIDCPDTPRVFALVTRLPVDGDQVWQALLLVDNVVYASDRFSEAFAAEMFVSEALKHGLARTVNVDDAWKWESADDEDCRRWLVRSKFFTPSEVQAMRTTEPGKWTAWRNQHAAYVEDERRRAESARKRQAYLDGNHG